MSVNWTKEDSEAALKQAEHCVRIARLEERIASYITGEKWSMVDYVQRVENRAIELMDWSEHELDQYEEVLKCDLSTRDYAHLELHILKHRERKPGDQEFVFDLRNLMQQIGEVEMYIEEEPKPVPEEKITKVSFAYWATETEGIPRDENGQIEWPSIPWDGSLALKDKTAERYAELDAKMTAALAMLQAMEPTPEPEPSLAGVLPPREPTPDPVPTIDPTGPLSALPTAKPEK